MRKIFSYINSRKPLKYGSGIALGAGIGFLYYYFIGCTSGSCPLTSKPFNSMLIGAVLGFIWVFSPEKSVKQE
jgi:urea transporter